MSWMHHSGYTPAYDHEGYGKPVVDLARLPESLRSRPASALVDVERWFGEVVTGYRTTCSCGWASPTVHPRGADITDEEAHLSPTELDHGPVHAEWRAHLAEVLPELVVYEALAKTAAGLGPVDSAVRAARKAGASWAAIGRAADITRQSAHERWRHLEDEEPQVPPQVVHTETEYPGVGADPDAILDRGGRIEFKLEEFDRAPEEGPAVYTVARAYGVDDVQVGAGYGTSVQAALADLSPEKAPAPVSAEDLSTLLNPPF